MKKTIIIILLSAVLVAAVIYFLKPKREPEQQAIPKQGSTQDSLEYFYETSQQLQNKNTNSPNQEIMNKLNDPNTTIK